MNTLTVWDHLYALAVFIIYPIIAAVTFPALVRRVRQTGERGRIAAYRQTIMTTFGLATLLCLMWLSLDRAWTSLGLRASTTMQLLAGLAFCALLLFVTVAQFRALQKSSSAAAGLPDHLLTLMPKSDREQKWFRAVSINAGVSEELIYRGYLIWYLSQMVDLVWAAALAVVLFTFAHSYQGIRQVPGLAFISAILVALYLLGGSLLLPILFHAVFDMVQGHFVARMPRQATKP